MILVLTSGAAAQKIAVVDVIPPEMSAEMDQNSEPSIAVNPSDPAQAIVTAFGYSTTADPTISPFFLTTDGGATWSLLDRQRSFDSTLSWSESGMLYLGRTSLLRFAPDGTITQGTQEVDRTFDPARTGAPFQPIPGSIYQNAPGGQVPDQPRVVAARVGRSDHIYLGYNDFSPFNGNQLPTTGNTATVQFSLDSGATWQRTVVDRGNDAGFADGPPVRLAVQGNHVYAAFVRALTIDPVNGVSPAQVVVVRDDRGGADGFNALGAEGTTVAGILAPFTSPLTGQQSVGHERIGSDLSLAVDPDDARHVLIAYTQNPPGAAAGTIQLSVQESSDGGQTWRPRFATRAYKAALPALAVADSGAAGLLYTSQRTAASPYLETHFARLDADSAHARDALLSSFADGSVPLLSQPYIGDYMGLVAVGLTFYGIFSASNQADGVHADFPGGVTFRRSYLGKPGTPKFQLTDSQGNPVPPSIDPFVFQVSTDP
jgi:hypothetical protein